MSEVIKANFICLSYSSIEFLFPKEDIIAASFCDKSNLIKDVDGNLKVMVSSQYLPFIDADVAVSKLNQEIHDKEIKTCIVIKNNGFFKDSENLAIVTSSDCKVIELPLDSFSLFSDIYSEDLKRKGIIACRFNEKIGYLIDIDKFLKKYQEIML